MEGKIDVFWSKSSEWFGIISQDPEMRMIDEMQEKLELDKRSALVYAEKRGQTGR